MCLKSSTVFSRHTHVSPIGHGVFQTRACVSNRPRCFPDTRNYGAFETPPATNLASTSSLTIKHRASLLWVSLQYLWCSFQSFFWQSTEQYLTKRQRLHRLNLLSCLSHSAQALHWKFILRISQGDTIPTRLQYLGSHLTHKLDPHQHKTSTSCSHNCLFDTTRNFPLTDGSNNVNSSNPFSISYTPTK